MHFSNIHIRPMNTDNNFLNSRLLKVVRVNNPEKVLTAKDSRCVSEAECSHFA